MSDFKREDRYIVLKISKMSDFQKDMIYPVIEEHGIPQVDCVVVEDDWPEYEAVWRMIERRITGSPPPSRLEMKHVMQALDQVRGGPVLTSNQCHDLAMLLNDYLPIEDTAQSELAALREELANLKSAKERLHKSLGRARARRDDVIDERDDMQKRLAAADQRNAELIELLRDIYNQNELSGFDDRRILAVIEPQSTESGASEFIEGSGKRHMSGATGHWYTDGVKDE